MDRKIDKRTSGSTNEGAEIGKERPITLEPRERERERGRLHSQTSKKKKTKMEGREEIDRAAPDCLAPGPLAPQFTSYRRNTSEHQNIRKNAKNPKPDCSNNVRPNGTIINRIANHLSENLLPHLIREHSATLSRRKNHPLLPRIHSLKPRRISHLRANNLIFAHQLGVLSDIKSLRCGANNTAPVKTFFPIILYLQSRVETANLRPGYT